MDSGDHNEGEKHHLRNFIAMMVKFFSRILWSHMSQVWALVEIFYKINCYKMKWWMVLIIKQPCFVMKILFFCHFKPSRKLHSASEHPVYSKNKWHYLLLLIRTVLESPCKQKLLHMALFYLISEYRQNLMVTINQSYVY